MKYQRGTTLIETVLYMGLLSGFLLILGQLLSQTANVQLETKSQSAVISDGRYITSRVLYDVGRADAIVTPASPGGSGGTLVLTIGGIEYTYSIAGTNMTLTDATGTENLNSYATTVSGVTFTRLGNPGAGSKNTVQLSFTLTSTTTRPGVGKEVRQFQSTGGIR